MTPTCKRRMYRQQKQRMWSENLEENQKRTASQKPREETVSNESSGVRWLHEMEKKEKPRGSQ